MHQIHKSTLNGIARQTGFMTVCHPISNWVCAKPVLGSRLSAKRAQTCSTKRELVRFGSPNGRQR